MEEEDKIIVELDIDWDKVHVPKELEFHKERLKRAYEKHNKLPFPK